MVSGGLVWCFRDGHWMPLRLDSIKLSGAMTKAHWDAVTEFLQLVASQTLVLREDNQQELSSQQKSALLLQQQLLGKKLGQEDNIPCLEECQSQLEQRFSQLLASQTLVPREDSRQEPPSTLLLLQKHLGKTLEQEDNSTCLLEPKLQSDQNISQLGERQCQTSTELYQPTIERGGQAPTEYHKFIRQVSMSDKLNTNEVLRSDSSELLLKPVEYSVKIPAGYQSLAKQVSDNAISKQLLLPYVLKQPSLTNCDTYVETQSLEIVPGSDVLQEYGGSYWQSHIEERRQSLERVHVDKGLGAEGESSQWQRQQSLDSTHEDKGEGSEKDIRHDGDSCWQLHMEERRQSLENVKVDKTLGIDGQCSQWQRYVQERRQAHEDSGSETDGSGSQWHLQERRQTLDGQRRPASLQWKRLLQKHKHMGSRHSLDRAYEDSGSEAESGSGSQWHLEERRHTLDTAEGQRRPVPLQWKRLVKKHKQLEGQHSFDRSYEDSGSEAECGGSQWHLEERRQPVDASTCAVECQQKPGVLQWKRLLQKHKQLGSRHSLDRAYEDSGSEAESGSGSQWHLEERQHSVDAPSSGTAGQRKPAVLQWKRLLQSHKQLGSRQSLDKAYEDSGSELDCGDSEEKQLVDTSNSVSEYQQKPAGLHWKRLLQKHRKHQRVESRESLDRAYEASGFEADSAIASQEKRPSATTPQEEHQSSVGKSDGTQRPAVLQWKRLLQKHLTNKRVERRLRRQREAWARNTRRLSAEYCCSTAQ